MKALIKKVNTCGPSPWSTLANGMSFSCVQSVFIERRRHKKRSSLSIFCFSDVLLGESSKPSGYLHHSRPGPVVWHMWVSFSRLCRIRMSKPTRFELQKWVHEKMDFKRSSIINFLHKNIRLWALYWVWWDNGPFLGQSPQLSTSQGHVLLKRMSSWTIESKASFKV